MKKRTLSQMKTIPAEELISRDSLPYDIYVALGPEKLVCIAHRGTKFSQDRLEQYATKNVKVFYADREDYLEYAKKTHAAVHSLLGREDLSASTKHSVLGRLAEKVFSDLEDFGFTHDMLDFARNVVDGSIKLVEDDLDVQSLLKSMETMSDSFMAHAMSVAAVSIMIARAQGWTVRANYESLALGGLLHDIGIKMLPSDIRDRPLASLSRDDMTIYQSHPLLGAKMLERVKSVSDEVVAIVREHHEYKGMGFPQGIKEAAIHPLARVVALADTFCHLTIKNAQFPEIMSPRQAVDHITIKLYSNFRPDDIDGLYKAVVAKKPAA